MFSLPNIASLTALVLKHRTSRPLLVALEGRCASGKTTLAARLQEELQRARPELLVNVFHLDDFFLRPEQRTATRLQKPGENVDHERFLAEVLLPLSQSRPVLYRPYDCHTQTLQKAISVPISDIAIVEGSYSCHPALSPYYQVRFLLDVEPDEQRQRLVKRNGEAGWKRFAELWIPLEERYFATLEAEFDARLSL